MPKGGVRSPKEKRKCLRCNNEYAPVTFWQKFCTSSCEWKTNRPHQKISCTQCGKKRVTTLKSSTRCMGCYQQERFLQASIDRERRFLFSVKKTPSCWVWMGAKNLSGHGLFISPEGRIVSRYAYSNFNGPIPKGMLVLHKCDNPSCVNPKHLEIGDYSKNLKDAYDRGLRKRSKKEKQKC